MYRNGRIHYLWVGFALCISLHGADYFVAQRNSRPNDGGPGTAESPWKTISKAALSVTPGDVVTIQDGIYRESVVLKTSGTAQSAIRFEAATGAHVIVTGADQLTDWRKSDEHQAIYEIDWPHCFNTWSKNMIHPDDEYHRLIGRCEQVAIQGYLLHQVLDRAQLSPGSFFADTANDKLLVWDMAGRDLNKILVEGSVRQQNLAVEGDYVRLRGLHFRFAANSAQHGAVLLAGRHDEMEDCVVEMMNSSGATFKAPDLVVRRCTFRDNGQIGFGANSAHNLLFTQCLVENNNTKGFERGWEAGGDKLVLSRGAVLERSRFLRNRGNGVWFDIGNENCIVKECLIADNEDSGIFYEISFGLQAHDNIIVGNGFAVTPGAWGAQAGISLSSSPACVIERNLIYGNREGFNFREQTRTTPRIGERGEQAIWNHEETIRHNIIVLNLDSQVWGWFDVNDGRAWPAEQGRGGPHGPTRENRKKDLSAAYVARGAQGQPTGLTLADLKIRFEENVYFAGTGQGLFEWGVTWGRHKSYTTLHEFQNDLVLDERGAVLQPSFADARAWDFRVDSEMMTELKSSYPQGEVPSVKLGLR